MNYCPQCGYKLAGHGLRVRTQKIHPAVGSQFETLAPKVRAVKCPVSGCTKKFFDNRGIANHVRLIHGRTG